MTVVILLTKYLGRIWKCNGPPYARQQKRHRYKVATHSSILAWRIPWTEEPGGLQSLGLQESDMTVTKPPPPQPPRWWWCNWNTDLTLRKPAVTHYPLNKARWCSWHKVQKGTAPGPIKGSSVKSLGRAVTMFTQTQLGMTPWRQED